MKTISSLIFISIVLSSVSFLSSCNTVEGAGRDISKAGRSIERAAQ